MIGKALATTLLMVCYFFGVIVRGGGGTAEGRRTSDRFRYIAAVWGGRLNLGVQGEEYRRIFSLVPSAGACPGQ